ncbi:MAG: hypothetical protein PHE78_08395 [Candidatus Gastranaerophilales bacterium]|nr:hypothetical protein [Candidatus Gastranaerophilales bacterium]
MTITLAITGKSGSGKTTVVKAFLRLFREIYPDKSILLFDNDLSLELGHSFNKDIRKTIYGIRSGKHEYKTGIPANMTKQEFVEWAIEDIIEPVEENVDMIVSWLIGSKDCRCPITSDIRGGLTKLIQRYDFVIFDCEFDLKYLNQLVDYPIDTTVIVAKATEEGVHLAQRIEEYSKKYAEGGQIGVILNKVKGGITEDISSMLNKYHLDILGVLPRDKAITNGKGGVKKDSEVIKEALREILFRLNLPLAGEI